MSKETVSSLKVGTGWIEIEIVSEPDVVLTFKGYIPVLRIQKSRTNVEYLLYISAKSLAEPLEELKKIIVESSMAFGYGFVKRAWKRRRNMKSRG